MISSELALDYLTLTYLLFHRKEHYEDSFREVSKYLAKDHDIFPGYLSMMTCFLEKYFDRHLAHDICPGSGDSIRNFEISIKGEKLLIEWVTYSGHKGDGIVIASDSGLEQLIRQALEEFHLQFNLPYVIKRAKTINRRNREYWQDFRK